MSDDEDKPGIVKKGVAALTGIVSAIYLLNLPLVPELPDLLPVVGNLDELAAAGVFLWSLRTLGIKPVAMLKGARERKRLKAATKELPEKA